MSTHSLSHQHCTSCQTRNLASAFACYFCGRSFENIDPLDDSLFEVKIVDAPTCNGHPLVNWGEGDFIINDVAARSARFREWLSQEERVIFFACYLLSVLVGSVVCLAWV